MDSYPLPLCVSCRVAPVTFPSSLRCCRPFRPFRQRSTFVFTFVFIFVFTVAFMFAVTLSAERVEPAVGRHVPPPTGYPWAALLPKQHRDGDSGSGGDHAGGAFEDRTDLQQRLRQRRSPDVVDTAPSCLI